MKVPIPAGICGLLVLPALLYGQFSGYVSGSYGYHNNPLYNYQRTADQLAQSYTELSFTQPGHTSLFRASYVSGLMVFNQLGDRNYYEHRLATRYHLSFRGDQTGLSEDHDAEEELEATDVMTKSEPHPSLDFALTVGARHDKQVFKEFDNLGAEFSAEYRFIIGEEFSLTLSNILGYRRYVYLSPLSNVTDIADLRCGSRPGSGIDYGLHGGAGVKRFTTSVYDTTRFEPARTYTLKPSGKGKPGARIKVPSSKQLLINPQSNTITQIVLGAYGGIQWNGGSSMLECVFRRNPGLPTRYLAQYANSSILNEDIYNDQFGYEGPDLKLACKQTLPFTIQVTLTLERQWKKYGAPALDLAGDQIAEHRFDWRSAAELYASRYFNLFNDIGLDLALAVTVVRNQSNDAYNDFSVFHIASSLGIGF